MTRVLAIVATVLACAFLALLAVAPGCSRAYLSPDDAARLAARIETFRLVHSELGMARDTGAISAADMLRIEDRFRYEELLELRRIQLLARGENPEGRTP